MKKEDLGIPTRGDFLLGIAPNPRRDFLVTCRDRDKNSPGRDLGSTTAGRSAGRGNCRKRRRKEDVPEDAAAAAGLAGRGVRGGEPGAGGPGPVAAPLLGGDAGQRLQPHHGQRAQEELRGVAAGPQGEEEPGHRGALQERGRAPKTFGGTKNLGFGNSGSQKLPGLGLEKQGKRQFSSPGRLRGPEGILGAGIPAVAGVRRALQGHDYVTPRFPTEFPLHPTGGGKGFLPEIN